MNDIEIIAGDVFMENHRQWFLRHHENVLNMVEESASSLYEEPEK